MLGEISVIYRTIFKTSNLSKQLYIFSSYVIYQFLHNLHFLSLSPSIISELLSAVTIYILTSPTTRCKVQITPLMTAYTRQLIG